MWEKISKEMQLPWRAAEAMHWQIGEVEMAQRANVPVFHLAGQHDRSHGSIESEARASTSPTASSQAPPGGMPLSNTHNHGLPQIAQSLGQPLSPIQARLRRNSSEPSPPGPGPIRRRADSAHSVPSASTPLSRTPLPPLINVTSSQAPAPFRYTLPPVVTSADGGRR